VLPLSTRGVALVDRFQNNKMALKGAKTPITSPEGAILIEPGATPLVDHEHQVINNSFISTISSERLYLKLKSIN